MFVEIRLKVHHCGGSAAQERWLPKIERPTRHFRDDGCGANFFLRGKREKNGELFY